MIGGIVLIAFRSTEPGGGQPLTFATISTIRLRSPESPGDEVATCQSATTLAP
jgi:hypothetical protein